jgi:hypothetical protein
MTFADILEGQAVNIRTDLYGEKISHRVETVSRVSNGHIYAGRDGAYQFSRATGKSIGPQAAMFGLTTYIELYQTPVTD